jgi:hypothetical protein
MQTVFVFICSFAAVPLLYSGVFSLSWRFVACMRWGPIQRHTIEEESPCLFSSFFAAACPLPEGEPGSGASFMGKLILFRRLRRKRI